MSYTIVGVIGHIDHGKTSLVAALTGIDTDTHPEEKQRGITIDLGFATYTEGDHRFALIDAPGHQKYIGNLLAGVAKVDVGLLVVACDQGIQAQTLEHAAILQSLGIQKLVVAMSRTDLADEMTQAELSEELDWFLAEHGFKDVPKIPLSAVTGEGFDLLRQQLRSFAAEPRPKSKIPFRMPIDRVFTIEGRGCVVAGTPWGGSLAIGDHATIVRTGQDVRVRELESHGLDVERTDVGVRTAINVVGVSAGEIVRGDELIEPGSVEPSDRMLAKLTLFSDASSLRLPTTVQLHTGTTSCEATLRGPREIDAGQSAVVVIDTDQPIVATFDQACLFRKPYPVGSFAGGRMLATVVRSRGQLKRLQELGDQLLQAADDVERLAAWVQFSGDLHLDTRWARNQLALGTEQVDAVVARTGETPAIHRIAEYRLAADWLIDRIRKTILRRMSRQAESTDDAWLPEEAVLGQRFSAASSATVRYVVDQLLKEKQLVKFRQLIALASEATVLSKKQRSMMEQILQRLRGERKPPTLKELSVEFDTSINAVGSLVRFAAQQQLVIDLGDGFVMDHEVFRELCVELHQLLEKQGEASVADIRDCWQITRKHAIPLLEYCDKSSITRRDQDVRRAGHSLQQIVQAHNIEEQTIE